MNALPSLILAADHRVQLVDAAKAAGVPVERCAEFKVWLVEAFLRARACSQQVAEHGGLILDDELGAEAIQKARAAGVPVAQPVERSGIIPLSLYPGYAERVLAQRPAFAKCLIFGRPDDASATLEPQQDALVELSHACRRADVPLVLELILPPRSHEDAADFERRRPELTAEWMRRLLVRGVRPSAWKLEGFERADAFAQVAAATGGDARIWVLGKGVPERTLARWLKAGRATGRCGGFAVGRTVFWEPFLAHLRGAPPDATVSAITNRYLDVVALWENA